MECKTCQILNSPAKDQIKVYEDDVCVAVLTTKPASMGHVILYPKQHYVIIEQVPDDIFAHLVEIANKISQASFESLGVQGTNILISNGTPAGQDDPHFSIHILGRKENDGVNLEWELKQAPEDHLNSIMNMYKEATDASVYSTDSKEQVLDSNMKDSGRVETIESSEEDDEENYLVKYMERRPGSN